MENNQESINLKILGKPKLSDLEPDKFYLAWPTMVIFTLAKDSPGEILRGDREVYWPYDEFLEDTIGCVYGPVPKQWEFPV